jgi:tRNA A37 threonylcarbamoyladenosine synthetase subunit TsaC/SUA5/YrdC
MTKARLTSLISNSHYFAKGVWPTPWAEYVPDPRLDEAVVFEDFFPAGLRMPPHPVLLDILHKFQVQLHQLTSNAVIHISKFIWVVTSCEGRPTADVFAHHYELHYQNKKIQLKGSESTFVAQFGCITFHPSRFGNQVRLTPAVRNKWMSGWDGNWFYCWVPLE